MLYLDGRLSEKPNNRWRRLKVQCGAVEIATDLGMCTAPTGTSAIPKGVGKRITTLSTTCIRDLPAALLDRAVSTSPARPVPCASKPPARSSIVHQRSCGRVFGCVDRSPVCWIATGARGCACTRALQLVAQAPTAARAPPPQHPAALHPALQPTPGCHPACRPQHPPG